MKKLVALIFLIVVVITIWIIVYSQYIDYKENRSEINDNGHIESISNEGKSIDERDFPNAELYDYLSNFLFDVIDGQFGIHVGKSATARMDYNSGQISLIEAIMIHDDAYADLETVMVEFGIPTFENLTEYERDSLQTIYAEIQGVKEAYNRQITGQKGLTFALAMDKGEDSFNVEAYSYEEQKDIAQKMVDESLDEILAFQLKVDTLCHEVIGNMERK